MDPNFDRGSSSVYRLEAHVSFNAKYCHEVFYFVEFRERCEEIFYEVARNEGFDIKELGFDRNHVHFVLRFRTTQRISEIAKALKGTSGRKLLKEFPEVKKKYFWGSGLWSPTMYADSLGRNPEEMASYVKKQAYSSMKFQKSLREFLN